MFPGDTLLILPLSRKETHPDTPLFFFVLMTSEREENCFFFWSYVFVRMFLYPLDGLIFAAALRWTTVPRGPEKEKHWEILVPAPRPSAPRKLAFRSQWRQLHPHTFAPGLFAVGDPCNTWLTHGPECGHKWPGLQHTTGQTQPSPANGVQAEDEYWQLPSSTI